MRKILILVTLMVCVFSCDKLPKDRTLEGQWQLINVDVDGVDKSVKADKLFWDLQLGVLQLDKGTPLEESAYEVAAYAHYRYTGDSLMLRDISSNCTYQETGADNIPMTKEQIEQSLAQYGIMMKDEAFKVGSLSNDYMVLSHGTKTLRFVKR